MSKLPLEILKEILRECGQYQSAADIKIQIMLN